MKLVIRMGDHDYVADVPVDTAEKLVEYGDAYSPEHKMTVADFAVKIIDDALNQHIDVV